MRKPGSNSRSRRRRSGAGSAAACIVWLALAAPSQAIRAATGRTAILDRVVAVVGDHAILASDVDDEVRFTAMQGNEPPADNTPQRGLERVLDRTLIDEQRALQPGLAEVPAGEVDKAIAQLRASIPVCADGACKSDAGWDQVLAAHGFTPAEVRRRIRERLAILKFINLRFGVAARVPNADVQRYYDQVLKPELERSHAEVPAFSAVSSRIREILRQRQVDAMVDQWIKGLRSEEQVRILDTAYGNGEDGQ